MSDEMLLHKAIAFAAVKHKAQTRKGTDTPYIVHPVEVMLLLRESGCPAYVAAAGVLHDTLEDTDTTYAELVENFGREVADLVSTESEDKSKSWRERKKTTIDELAVANTDTKLICLADKLSNLMSMVYDYGQVGEQLWDRFNADKVSIAWYYRGIINATADVHCILRERLKDCYLRLFGENA